MAAISKMQPVYNETKSKYMTEQVRQENGVVTKITFKTIHPYVQYFLLSPLASNIHFQVFP